MKTYKHVINGETVEIDRGIWALKSDAVPCLFPNLPSYLSSQRKKRRSPKKRATAAKNEQPMSRDRPTDFQPEPPVPVKAFDFVNILESSGSLQLPKNWRSAALEEEPGERRQIVFYDAGMKAGAYTILKSVVIREDLSFVVHANGKLLQRSLVDLQIRSSKDVEAILQIVHIKQFCRGCSHSALSSSSVAEKVGDILYHKDCLVLTDADRGMCTFCASLTKSLKRKLRKTQPRKKVRVAASVLRKRLIRATAARERKKREVQRLSEKLKDAFMISLDDIVQDLP